MLKDRAEQYFIGQDYNCAETALRAIRDEYGLDISEDDLKLVSAFGGGMGCGKTCGVLCGCLAAYGKMDVKNRAHEDKSFAVRCKSFCELFNQKLGNTQCSELKIVYRNDKSRCLKTVELGLEAFEEFINSQKK